MGDMLISVAWISWLGSSKDFDEDFDKLFRDIWLLLFIGEWDTEDFMKAIFHDALSIQLHISVKIEEGHHDDSALGSFSG